MRIQAINWKKNTHQKVSQTLANGGIKYDWIYSDTMDMEFSLTARGYAKYHRPLQIESFYHHIKLAVVFGSEHL